MFFQEVLLPIKQVPVEPRHREYQQGDLHLKESGLLEWFILGYSCLRWKENFPTTITLLSPPYWISSTARSSRRPDQDFYVNIYRLMLHKVWNMIVKFVTWQIANIHFHTNSCSKRVFHASWLSIRTQTSSFMVKHSEECLCSTAKSIALLEYQIITERIR